MSWVELDRIVSEEIVRDDDIRRRVAASGRPLRSHATGMSDDDLLAKLRGLGMDADREKLAGLCDGALSAEEVVSERLRLHDWNADWAWICLTELWQRWWPEKACLELLDDKIQEGYAAGQRNDLVASGRIWLGAWSDVLRMCDATGARSIREFDDRFPMTQSLFNWCQDLEVALQNGGEHDPELRTARLEMAAEWLRRFPGEDGLITGNFRRALADSYFETGHRQQAEKDRRRAGRATAWAVPTVPAGEPRAAKQYPAGRTGRNQPCPCGSGKKFKKCCGALRRHERTGATCALRWSVAQHSPAAAGRGCGVPWVGLWLTAPCTVAEADEAALDPLL